MATASQRLRRPSPSLEFDSLLSLEESFYNAGYTSGLADGHAAGLRDGRILGLKQGFERFSSMGKMSARSVVWGSRLPDSSPPHEPQSQSGVAVDTAESPKLPQFESAKAARLEKHVRVLFALAELESLSLQNDEADVAECVDRFDRARSKFKVIGRMVGEDVDEIMGGDGRMDRGIEDVGLTKAKGS